ncbi:Eco57I restriction-modification methylase domain-containing protein [Novosphingopyxis iocasae]|uniref:Eco57I restriction-modification methylase domain-containing protein n=1 Tax=Novosphingopyxis iocasae TaxID=2762729 RepID=UPI0016517245|nr:N-6 DNA methylase [Novosphingopyxis iocasae]
MSREVCDLGSIWRWLAVEHFRLAVGEKPGAPGEMSELFRLCVTRSFYALAKAMCDKSARITISRGLSQVVAIDGAALCRLIPEAAAIASGKLLEEELSAKVGALLAESVLEPASFGDAFESLYGDIPNADVQSGSRATRDRNTRGVFYTPAALVEELCDQALTPALDGFHSIESLSGLAVLDPAMGGGRFLIEAAQRIAARAELLEPGDQANGRKIALTSLYGVDRDALAVDVARLSLWLAGGAEADVVGMLRRHFIHGDSIAGPAGSSSDSGTNFDGTHQEELDWARTFPGILGRDRPGFDLVIGNPPWGKIKAEYKRFLTASVGAASQLQGAQLRRYVQTLPEGNLRRHATTEWEDHSSAVKAYAERLKCRFAGNDEISGRGDADLYKYFMARSLQLTREGGTVALIIPASFRNTEGTASLRRKYFGCGHFTFFTERTNRRRHFPIHSMFRFVSFVFRKDGVGGIDNMLFVDGQKRGEPVHIGLDELRAVAGDDLLIPEVRDQREFDLLKRLYGVFEPLGSPGQWNIRFNREVDMTNASAQFIEQKPQTQSSGFLYLPLFEGRMVDQFDYAAKEYIGGAGRRAQWRRLLMGAKRIRPHYLLPVRSTDPKLEQFLSPRAAFCDITGHANRRTVLAAVLPGGVASGNKVPTCRFEPVNDPRFHLLWVAIANSLTVNWLVRRRISTTLNFFHLYAIPFPRLDPSVPEAKRLIRLAASLVKIDDGHLSFARWLKDACGHDAPAVVDTCERQSIIDEIDKVVFGLYGLVASEVALIKSDFKDLATLGCDPELQNTETKFARPPKAAAVRRQQSRRSELGGRRRRLTTSFEEHS